MLEKYFANLSVLLYLQTLFPSQYQIIWTLWTPVLEKYLANLTMELLQKLFNEQLEPGGNGRLGKFLSAREWRV